MKTVDISGHMYVERKHEAVVSVTLRFRFHIGFYIPLNLLFYRHILFIDFTIMQSIYCGFTVMDPYTQNYPVPIYQDHPIPT